MPAYLPNQLHRTDPYREICSRSPVEEIPVAAFCEPVMNLPIHQNLNVPTDLVILPNIRRHRNCLSGFRVVHCV